MEIEDVISDMDALNDRLLTVIEDAAEELRCDITELRNEVADLRKKWVSDARTLGVYLKEMRTEFTGAEAESRDRYHREALDLLQSKITFAVKSELQRLGVTRTHDG